MLEASWGWNLESWPRCYLEKVTLEDIARGCLSYTSPGSTNCYSLLENGRGGGGLSRKTRRSRLRLPLKP